MGYIHPMDSQRGPAADPAALFAEAVSIMKRLRAPGGCPWDREQTFDSIKPYTLEEAYEVFDAIDRRHWQDLCEELGDLLLQVLFYAEMATEDGYFTISEVIAVLNRKLIRRHPHVFGDQDQQENSQHSGPSRPELDSAQVLRNWDAIKREEKKDRPDPESELDHVLRSLPALLEARKLGSRAAKSGFDWPDIGGLFEKLEEEISELQEAIGADTSSTAAASEAVVSEVGDLLFTAVNLARRLRVNPEFALRHSNAKFRRRFRAMETAASAPLESLSPDQLDLLWNQAKSADNPVSTRVP